MRVKVASLPDNTFEGKISRIGSVVEAETRVVPVKAEINNPKRATQTRNVLLSWKY